MQNNSSIYRNPLIQRYSSNEMLEIFSDDNKFITWRKLWIALAKSEKELGLNISDEQISQLEENISNIDYDLVAEYESKVRHDVMAHILAYGDICPEAKPIIHLGATSAFVGDNTDLIIMRQALDLILLKIAKLISRLSEFALEYKELPALGFTHFQPAQLTTVGKRTTLWIHDLLIDLHLLEDLRSKIHLRGAKGTTGTQASYMNLFDGNEVKVKKLDLMIAEKMNFDAVYPVTGQTSTRKIDALVLSALSQIAVSLNKMTNDIRILQSLKELEEPFEKSQIGSSAMAYKRNPMRSERVASLSKFVISLSSSPMMVASTQWLERTLDDSANKRITIAESFLAIDASLDISINIASGLNVYPKVISARINSELPFMATENIIMQAVKKGGDRQELHEKIRVHSMEAAKVVKEKGLKNDLIDRIASDNYFKLSKVELLEVLKPENYIGRSVSQVDEFISEYVNPSIIKYKNNFTDDSILKV